MRLLLMTALTMSAFAANSLLTRYGVDGGLIDAGGFAFIRVLSGALVLLILLRIGRWTWPALNSGGPMGVLGLAAYMIGFSLAYVSLDAGLGALILFGVVQIAMFAHAATTTTRPTHRQIAGAVIAFLGLVVVLWPGAGAHTDLVGALLMALAGLGWAAYSIVGRRARDPLAATAANFTLCLPLMLLPLLFGGTMITLPGLAIAAACGGLTSGLGYALWYAVLPRLDSSTGAVVQLCVPILAILGGALFLDEPLRPLLAIAAALVVGGIALSVTARSAREGRSRATRGP